MKNCDNKNACNRDVTKLRRIKQLYPWLIWFLSSSFIFYKYVLQVSPSIMVFDLMKTFSLSGVLMGNLAAFYFYAYLVMQIPVGILLDHFSPRRLMTLAIAVCAFGAFVFAKSSYLYEAELGRLLIGVGGAFSAVGTMKLISMWFPSRRFALVSGLMMTMAMLGAVGGQAPLAFLVSKLEWRLAMIWVALLGVLLMACFWLLVREKAPTKEKPFTFNFKVLVVDMLRIMKNKQSWLISLYSGLAFSPISAFAGLWGIPFIVEKYGISHQVTAGMMSLVFVGFALGSPLAGWLSDYVGVRKPIMIIGTSMSLLTLVGIIYIPEMKEVLLAGLLLVFGFFSGFFFVSFAHMREINNPKLSGTSIGFINMFNAMCGALSEPLIGKLLDLGWGHQVQNGVRIFTTVNYQHALIALPIALAVALCLQYFIKESYCKQVYAGRDRQI